MVQVIETGGNAAGRIGKGFGKGLSEQIPKEVERHRLSSGLRKLGEKKFDPKNQLSNLADLYAIPGLAENPELAKLAQNQIAKQNFQNRQIAGKKGNAENKTQNQSISASGEKISPETGKVAEKSATTEGGFVGPSEIAEYKKGLLQTPTYEDKYNLANEYLNNGITQDPGEAMQLASQELGQNLEAQKTKNATLRADLNDRVARTLQGTGLNDYKDISGEIQQGLIDQGEYMVNKLGMTPEQASQELSNIALNLGKASTNLKETGSRKNMFRSSARKTSELREQKKEFDKYGFGEQFDDMASAAMGTTPLMTAHILDPLKNKELNDKLKGLKKSAFHAKGTAGITGGGDLKDKELDDIVKSIKPGDNLFSVEYELRDKGYNINQFKTRVSKLEAENQIALTPQQKRQQKRTVKQGIYGDILYESF